MQFGYLLLGEQPVVGPLVLTGHLLLQQGQAIQLLVVRPVGKGGVAEAAQIQPDDGAAGMHDLFERSARSAERSSGLRRCQG